MPSIVIVGAGIAGLAAALTLQDAGLSSTLYEASQRIGGRIHSDTTTWPDSLVSEWCGEFIDDTHSTMLQLIARFNLPITRLGDIMVDHAQSILYFLHRYYREQDLADPFHALAPILQQQMHDAGYPTTHTHYTSTGYELDHLSAYDWIEHYVDDGHNSPVGRLLDATCCGLLGLDTHEQSSLNLLYTFAPQDTSSKSLLPRPLQSSSKIVGGNQRLPLAIANSLPPEQIHLQHQLIAIERKDDDSLLLTFRTPHGDTQVSCEHAILTLPFSTLRHVDYQRAGFDTLKRTAIEELGYGTISKLFLHFDQPYWYNDDPSTPWPHPHSGFITTDLDIQSLWDESIGQQGGGALLVNYTSGHHGAAYSPSSAYTSTSTDADIQRYAQDCLRQLEQVLPGISAHYTGTASLGYPTGDPHLLGSYSCWRVGQYTRFAGYEGTAQGTIHFAGEHCSIDFQGFMEGAAREGIRSAHEIIHPSR
jgi:monoamine oxidase